MVGHAFWVLQKLWQHKLCANLDKCTFGLAQVQYLGYIIDECGVHVDPTKIQVIRDWPAPTTLTKLRSFLGLANSIAVLCWDSLILLGPEVKSPREEQKQNSSGQKLNRRHLQN